MTKARSNATANAAKGDLTVGTGTNLSGVLSAGNNGEALVLDSSTSTGLRWQGSMAAGRNFANNGGFDVWQRGTSFASPNNTYTADRWSTLLGSPAPATTVSRQATGDTTNLPFIQYCARVARNSGQTNTGAMYLTQSIESINSIPLAGKTVTFSFYARKGANYSGTSSGLGFDFNSGTGTDQNINGGFTGNVSVISQSATLTTTWQRFSYSGTVPTTATQIGFYFSYTPTGTAGAADYFEVTGVQVEVGSVATQFTRQGGTIQGELQAAQRYYFRSQDRGAFGSYTDGYAQNSTIAWFTVPLPSSMRIKPSSVDYSTLRVLRHGAVGFDVTSLSLDAASSTNQAVVVSATVASGLATGEGYTLGNGNSSSGYLGFSAEL